MEELIRTIRLFVRERDWDQFHSPKNLSMALIVEAAEIVEIFQWMDETESSAVKGEQLDKVEQEIGDVMIYLTNLADKLGLDPVEAAKKKLRINQKKYPVEMVRGKSKKYTEYFKE